MSVQEQNLAISHIRCVRSDLFLFSNTGLAKQLLSMWTILETMLPTYHGDVIAFQNNRQVRVNVGTTLVRRICNIQYFRRKLELYFPGYTCTRTVLFSFPGRQITNYNGLFQVMPPEDQEEKLGTDILNGEPFKLRTVEVSCHILKIIEILQNRCFLKVSN